MQICSIKLNLKSFKKNQNQFSNFLFLNYCHTFQERYEDEKLRGQKYIYTFLSSPKNSL